MTDSSPQKSPTLAGPCGVYWDTAARSSYSWNVRGLARTRKSPAFAGPSGIGGNDAALMIIIGLVVQTIAAGTTRPHISTPAKRNDWGDRFG